MKVSTTQKVTVTLELTQEEAQWPHEVMRNPLGDTNPNHEADEDANLREMFYNATSIPG